MNSLTLVTAVLTPTVTTSAPHRISAPAGSFAGVLCNVWGISGMMASVLNDKIFPLTVVTSTTYTLDNCNTLGLLYVLSGYAEPIAQGRSLDKIMRKKQAFHMVNRTRPDA